MTELPTCRRCRDRTEVERPLRRLQPSIYKNSKKFANKTLPLIVCEECDGEVFARATAKHARKKYPDPGT